MHELGVRFSGYSTAGARPTYLRAISGKVASLGPHMMSSVMAERSARCRASNTARTPVSSEAPRWERNAHRGVDGDVGEFGERTSEN